MEWLEDSRACFAVSELLIDEIERMFQESMRDEKINPYIKVKIKNCLENCRSPLDYVAHYIFDEYCAKEYTPKELKKASKVYYPIETQDFFSINIRKKFRSLTTKRPDIVSVFEQSQPFSGDEWLMHLTKLINENKHRNLTKQDREKTVHIKSGHIGGLHLHNVTMVNVGTPIKIGDTKLDFVTPSPYDHLFDKTVAIEYFFKDLGLSVIPTLKAILIGSKKVIDEMEKII